MSVHVSSVISTTIQTYDSALYTALTDKENDSYTATNINITAGQEVATYQPQYQTLSDDIVAYMSGSRQTDVHNLFSIAYAYRIMNLLYATDYSLEPSLKATSLFTMNGESTSIKASAVTAFSDYDGIVFPSISASQTAVSGALAAESSTLTGLVDSMTSVIQGQSNILLVEDPTQGVAPTKQSMGQWWYGTSGSDMGYSSINIPLNMGFSVPSYVT